MILVKLLCVTNEIHGFASSFSRWSDFDPQLLALVASLQSCGRRLRIYCVIEIIRTISRNNTCGWSRTLYIYAYSAGMECAMIARFSPSYGARVVLSNEMRNSILNFCAEWYIPFPRAGHIYKQASKQKLMGLGSNARTVLCTETRTNCSKFCSLQHVNTVKHSPFMPRIVYRSK